MNNKLVEIKGLTPEELSDFFMSIDEPAYRGSQLFNYLYNRLSANFSEMTNFSKELRLKLDSSAAINSLKLIELQSSVAAETKKYLFETRDGKKIESVLIPEKDRNTLCVSTQSGCPLDCKFCATGLMGFKRNLSAGEILDQYVFAARDAGKENITNIVYMGMGEPLINYDSTVKSLRILTDGTNKSISRTRITLSTAGITTKIIELADSGLRVKLALSLHSPFDDIRSRIMPVNKRFPLKDVLKSLSYYAEKTKTRITFEYTMLKGVNDRPEDINELIKICRKIPSKMNLIPFNSISHMAPEGISSELRPTGEKNIEIFADSLRNAGITVMLRNTQGSDIAAACGQLAAGKE